MVKNSIIWIIGLAIALTSGLLAMGAVAKDKAPALAITLHPINGFAAENIASESIKTSIAENSGQFPDHVGPKATEFARKAFIAEPITPEAVAVLAFGEADQDKRKLMNEALLLSRRQPLVTGWMIADSGAREDVSALLNNYDILIRSSSSAASAVISVMAGALANDSFITPFAEVLKKQPPWASQFWSIVAGTPDAFVNAARLREALYKPGENEEVYRDADLIRALVSTQEFEQAEVLYNLIVDRKIAGDLIKNGSFDAQPTYEPLDWQLLSSGEYGAAIVGGRLELSAIRNSGGLFARQLVKLPSRSLSLKLLPSTPISSGARIFITLTCSEKIANVPLPITIPVKSQVANLKIDNSRSGCNFYWFDINGRASESGDGFDVAFDDISLR